MALEKECDEVLTLLDTKKYPRPNTTGDCSNEQWFYHFVIEELPHISKTKLNTILAILYNDGYIELLFGAVKVPNSHHYPKTQFTISPKGVAFINTNSYTICFKQKERQKRNDRIKDWMLIIGSILAGIGTILLFTVEILKHFYWEK